VFFKDAGTAEIRLTVLDIKGLSAVGSDLVALVTLYDGAGVAFFSVGINDHDVMVGSYPLHPMIMEDAFGGVGFPYVSKLDGLLRDGTDVTVTVTWGRKPSDDCVYVNGRLVETKLRKGPKTLGKGPGYEPLATLGPFMGGFKTWDGRVVGPPRTFTVGRMGVRDISDHLSMYPPTVVAVKSVRLTNFVDVPMAKPVK